MDKTLLQILVCPICKGKLIHDEKEHDLICLFDRLSFPIVDGVPIMLPKEAKELSLEELDNRKK